MVNAIARTNPTLQSKKSDRDREQAGRGDQSRRRFCCQSGARRLHRAARRCRDLCRQAERCKKLQFDPRADAWLRGGARVFDVDAMFRKAADGPDAGFRCHGSIVLCLLEMRNDSPGLMRARKFPYAAIVMIAHGIASAVPIIEGANHANTVGVWRPHRKCNAFRPSLSSSGGC
jgi:hypothetical protein